MASNCKSLLRQQSYHRLTLLAASFATLFPGLPATIPASRSTCARPSRASGPVYAPVKIGGPLDLLVLAAGAAPNPRSKNHKKCCFPGYQFRCYVDGCHVAMACAADMKVHVTKKHEDEPVGEDFDYGKLVHFKKVEKVEEEKEEKQKDRIEETPEDA